MMVEEKMIERIRKMLAKTTNNPSAEEAQTALLMAQELMAKHGLTMKDFEVAKQASKEVIQGEATDWTKLPWWYKKLSTILADNFRCYTFWRNSGRHQKLIFMGVKEDVEVCQTLFNYSILFVTQQAVKLRKKARKEGNSTDGLMNDYVSGFLSGLSDRYQEQVKKNDWGLILVKDAELITQYEAMTIKIGKESTITRAFNNEAYQTGYKHGRALSDPVKQLN